MVCANINECFEQIDAYYTGERTGYLLLVNTENYDAYQEILQRLQADSSNHCVYVSNFMHPNGLPDTNAATNAALGEEKFALIGLSQALMLQSSEALEQTLDVLLGHTTNGRGTVLLEHCEQILKRYMRRDPRLSGRVVLVDGQSTPLPRIHIAKSEKECIGFSPLPDISHLLKKLENMTEQDLKGRPTLTVVSSLMPKMFSKSVFSVSEADGIYESICRFYPDVAAGTEKCFGTDEQWRTLTEKLQKSSSLSAVVCESFGATTNLSAHIRDVFDSANDFEKWLLWLSLMAFGEKNNKYLTFVLEHCSSISEFSEQAYLGLADIDVTHPDFARFYTERKRLISQLPEELPLIQKYCNKVGIHGKNEVFYLSDNSEIERYEFLRCLEMYDYTNDELKKAVNGMSKSLSMYMREFTFDSTNTKLADADLSLTEQLTSYFNEYKLQKITNKIHEGFIAQVEQYAAERPYNKLKPRSKIVSQLDKTNTQLFFFDALGVEYLAFIKAKCEEYGLVCELEIGRCELPSITERNKDFLQFFAQENTCKIDKLDEIKHHSSVYDYRKCELPLHLFEELEVIDEELRRIQSMLVQGTMKKALIVSDHGASRLAVRYGKESAALIELDESGEHSGRCCPAQSDPHILFAAFEDGYSVLANYERFRGGRRANVEVHGGAALEEVIVPVIMLTKRPENVEFCFTDSIILLVPREIPTLMLYANIPMKKPRLFIDGEYIDGELMADNRHAKFTLPKIKRKGNYEARVFDDNSDMGVTLPFTVQKQTREVDLFN